MPKNHTHVLLKADPNTTHPFITGPTPPTHTHTHTHTHPSTFTHTHTHTQTHLHTHTHTHHYTHLQRQYTHTHPHWHTFTQTWSLNFARRSLESFLGMALSHTQIHPFTKTTHPHPHTQRHTHIYTHTHLKHTHTHTISPIYKDNTHTDLIVELCQEEPGVLLGHGALILLHGRAAEGALEHLEGGKTNKLTNLNFNFFK